MTVSNYLKRNPNARGSTIAWIAKRDEKVEQLRRETRQAKEAKGYKLPRLFSAVADAFRSWRA